MFLFNMEHDEKLINKIMPLIIEDELMLGDDWNESLEVEEQDDPLFEVEKENAESVISRLNNQNYENIQTA